MLSPERIANLLRDQAHACAMFGSPLYARLLTCAAEDAEGRGIVFDLLSPFNAPNTRADALALRLMAAVHRLVLTGEAPRLAASYPSVVGRADPEAAWPAFHQALLDHRDRLPALVSLPCQTNEVGRAAALIFGFFELAAAANGLPLRLLEVGASAGLNLRFDRFRYGGGGAEWGDPKSPVDLRGLWIDAPRVLPASITVCARRGCDPRPLDVRVAADRLGLQAAVWADQVERFSRLQGALEIAIQVPVDLERASVDEWLPRQLAEPRPGQATVVYHSIVQEYFSESVRRAFHECLAEAGARASTEAPLFWLRLEPRTDNDILRYQVLLTSWPGGVERVIAWAGPHGADVRRA